MDMDEEGNNKCYKCRINVFKFIYCQIFNCGKLSKINM